MTARWLLHTLLCAWYRWRAREALQDAEWSRQAQVEARNRMQRALAREEEEARAWARYRKQMREAAE